MTINPTPEGNTAMPRDPEWDRLDAEDLAEAIAERLTPAHLEEHDLDYLTRDPYPWERTL